jgi:hypothetical protein
MSIIKRIVTQTVLNTTTELALPTGITVDGKAGWLVNRVDFWLASAPITPITPSVIVVQLNTETGNQPFTDPDSIALGIYLTTGIAASTTAIQVNTHTFWESASGRLTVEPNLYINLATAGLTAVCSVMVSIDYDVIKLTDLEVMRLLQGGA